MPPEDLIHFNVCVYVCVCVQACLITNVIQYLSFRYTEISNQIIYIFWQTSQLTFSIPLIPVYNLYKFCSS